MTSEVAINTNSPTSHETSHSEAINLEAVGLLSWLPNDATPCNVFIQWLEALPKGWPLLMLDLEPDTNSFGKQEKIEALNAYKARLVPLFGCSKDRALWWGLAQIETPWAFWLSPQEVLQQHAPYDFEDILLQLATQGEQAALFSPPIGDWPFTGVFLGHSDLENLAEVVPPRLLKTELVKASYWQANPSLTPLLTTLASNGETFGLSIKQLQNQAETLERLSVNQSPAKEAILHKQPCIKKAERPEAPSVWQQVWAFLLRLFR